jgi:hypothetical protein
LIPLLALQYATNGQFLTHIFFHNQNAYTVSRAVEMLSNNVWTTLPVLGLAAASIGVRWAERANFTIRCLLIYLVLAFLVSWTSGKDGSASSYFLEFNVICCAFAGLAVTTALDPARQVRTLATVAIVLLGIWAGARSLPRIANGALQLTAGARALATERGSEARRALDIVRSAPGPVFSWDLMVVVLADKDVPIEPAVMFDLARAGKWDIAPFVKEIREGYYGLIVASSDAQWLTSDAVSQAMASAYAPAEQFGSYHFYRPIRR